MTGRLAGKVIAVTRPQAQAGPLAAAIAAAGGEAFCFPLLDIAPADDLAPLAAAVARLADYDFAAFVSPNAVDHALPAILRHGPWPGGLQALAVGPGTVKALAAHGVGDCLAPSERFDSEALLDLPGLAPAQVAGRRVALFRGDGGRELLAETLRARGAVVDAIPCYRRSAPGDFTVLADAARLDGITLSSSEALRHLVAGLGIARVRDIPLFVPHARIAELAQALGLTRVILTPPADQGLIDGLLAYNWSA